MSRFEIRKTYRFCASHRLARPEWDDAKNREVFGSSSLEPGHGHNYRLTVVLFGTPDAETARLFDLHRLDELIEERVLSVYDHRNLNADVPTLEGRVTTLETLLADAWDRIEAALPAGLLHEISLVVDETLQGVYRGPASEDAGPRG